jgi:phage/plasmid-like protein (TIGR03299 family)
MIKEAGLDWEVELVPAYYFVEQLDEETGDRDEFLDELTGAFVIRRKDTGRVIGYSWSPTSGFTVGHRYAPLQNHEMFAFGDALKSTGEVKWHTAGSLRGGRTVWALAKTEGQFSVQRRGGSSQAIEPYLMLGNGHDGQTSLWVQYTSVYVECWNTLQCAINRASTSFRVRHTDGLRDRVEEAREALGLAAQYHQEVADFSQILADSPFDASAFTGFAAQLLTDIDDEDEALEKVATAKGRTKCLYDDRGVVLARFFGHGKGSMGGVDALDALNAVTEWVDHYRGRDKLIVEVEQSIDDAKSSVTAAETRLKTLSDERSGLIHSLNEKALQSAWHGHGATLKKRAVTLLKKRLS